MTRYVIIGGAPISDYAYIKSLFCDGDRFIFCDSGLYHQSALGINADIVVGDFDSHPVPETDAELVVLPREKDDTDTVYAAKLALGRGADKFLIIGVSGGRTDHALGNIYLLLYLANRGASAMTADDECEMLFTNEYTVDKRYKFFSVLNIDGSADGITITSAKFPIENAKIECEYQYGISNEVVGECATGTVQKGRVLIVLVR
jgi:thiamine pyrophosphokinase